MLLFLSSKKNYPGFQFDNNWSKAFRSATKCCETAFNSFYYFIETYTKLMSSEEKDQTNKIQFKTVLFVERITKWGIFYVKLFFYL